MYFRIKYYLNLLLIMLLVAQVIAPVQAYQSGNSQILPAGLNDGEIVTIAGVPPKGDGLAARNAQLQQPLGIAFDNSGNLFFTDSGNNLIRRVDAVSGIVTTIAGNGELGFSGDNGPALMASFNRPQRLSFDLDGNLLIGDQDNKCIRRLDLVTNTVTTIAGTGKFGSSGDGGPAINALIGVNGLTVDRAGNILIVGESDGLVRKIDSRTGIIDTIAGGGSDFGDNVSARKAFLNGPRDIEIDATGNLYIAEARRVRFINTATNIVTTVAGNERAQELGDDGPAINAQITPVDIELDSVGNLIIADLVTQTIRRVDTRTGIIKKIAGDGTRGFRGDGDSALAARFNIVRDLTFDRNGNLILADSLNNCVRRLDFTSGLIDSIVGRQPNFGNDGELATNGLLNSLTDIVRDRAGNLYIAEPASNIVRRVDAKTGIITTVAGNRGDNLNPKTGDALDISIKVFNIALDQTGNLLLADISNNLLRRLNLATGELTNIAGDGFRGANGDGGPASQARVAPYDVAVDRSGNIFIVDETNNIVRRIDAATGIITTVAGQASFSGSFKGDGGPATAAGFRSPEAIAIDDAGNLYISDRGNSRIRRVDAATGIIETIAGTGETDFFGDGGLAINAKLNSPRGLLIDPEGNIIFTDSGNNRIRKIDRAGIISTIVGIGRDPEKGPFSGEGGPAINATLEFPFTMLLDSNGDLLISDSGNNRVRLVDAANKNINTIVGGGSSKFKGDNGLARDAQFFFPGDIVSDQAHNLYIADRFNNRVRRIDAATGIITTYAGNGSTVHFGDGGNATQAGIGMPQSLGLDAAGNLYIATSDIDSDIRRVDAVTGTITTLLVAKEIIDRFNQPLNIKDMTVDLTGNIYISESTDRFIYRRDATTGKVAVYAGNGNIGFRGDGKPAKDAELSGPTALDVDDLGNLYFSDAGNFRVRKIDVKSNIITTLAGNGEEGNSGDGGPAKAAALVSFELEIDPLGNIFVVALNGGSSKVVRRIDAASGIISTVVGNGVQRYLGESVPALNASLAQPEGLGVDRLGNLYISDFDAVRAVKGISAVLKDAVINDVVLMKKDLIITGDGYGLAPAQIMINGKDVSMLIDQQSNLEIRLKGTKKKLNLKKGDNQIVVTAHGTVSNTFVLNLLSPLELTEHD